MDKLKLAALVREIGKVAPQVAQERAEQQAAFTESYNAKATLLTEVIDLARPALAAISNQISCRNERGVVLADGWLPEPNPDFGQCSAEEPRIYLLSDGRLMKAWRCRDMEMNHLTVGMAETSPHEVVIEHDVTDLVAVIHNALAKQAGRRVASTEKAREEASKLHAILTLLDAPPAAQSSDDIPF